MSEHSSSELEFERSKLDIAVLEFLLRVSFFQNRAWKKNPTKARSKRRLIAGMREIEKYINLGSIKVVIIAKDIESDCGKEKLFEQVRKIRAKCAESNVPVIEACHKHKIGRTLQRNPFVSVVAVLDYQGAEDSYNMMMSVSVEVAHLINKVMISSNMK